MGGTILGTGGGGSYETAEHLAKNLLRRKSVRLVPPKEVPDRANVIAVAGMGSPEAMLRTPFTREAQHAFDALVQHMGKRATHVIPIETSGFNFLAPMTVASVRPVAVIDGDAAGRAIPQLNQTLFYARGIPLSPLSLADSRGRTVVIQGTEYGLSEKAAIGALEYFGWSAGLACYPMNGEAARRASVSGTISLAREVGIAIRTARETRADPLHAVLGVTGGMELIRGTVDRFETETAGSYKFGNLEVVGAGPHAGGKVRVKSMNENMIAWKNDRLVAVAPDRVCFMRPDGSPVTNADLSPGQELVIFVIESQSQWKMKAAVRLFAPTLTAMGYSGPYVPTRRLLMSA